MEHESLFANCPTVIAILDIVWGGVAGDAYDNDPIYYEHHEGDYVTDDEDEEPSDGFVPRGEHYVVLTIGANGKVDIGIGYHKSELPTHAHILTENYGTE